MSTSLKLYKIGVSKKYKNLVLIYKPLLKYSILGTASVLAPKYVAALLNFSGS